MVKLVRFLRVVLVVFGMSGTLLVVFISCNILFVGGGCQGVSFSFGEKNEKIFVFAVY